MYKSSQGEGEDALRGTNPEQRWRLQKAGSPEREFYTDEHPEIPKIRRASRSINQGTGSHPSIKAETRSLPATEQVEEETKRSTTRGTRRIAPSRRVDNEDEAPLIATSRPGRGNSYRQASLTEEDDEQPQPRRSNALDRANTVRSAARSYGHGSRQARLRPVNETREDNSNLYERQRRFRMNQDEEDEDAYYARKRTRRPLLPTTQDMAPERYHRQIVRVRRVQQRTRNAIHDQFLALRQNRKTLIILAIIATVLIISVPILISLLHQQQQNTAATARMNNAASIPGIQNATQPTDPHELVITPAGGNHPAPPVYASAAYLLDASTGATLYAYNPFVHLPIMSTTKLMTALIAVQQENLNKKITITPPIQNDLNQLAADSSLMGIKANETYTLNELLHGLLLMSGNDAAVVIADGLAGNQTRFVAEMNQRATQMGLHDTHFENPHGLLENGHYSSAHDLAIMARYSLSNSTIQRITDTKIYQLPATSAHHAITMSNSDQFLWWYPGVNAGKTGWDDAANFVQVISVVRNNRHLIGVVIHTRDWWTDMRDLMNWGFNNFTWLSPRDINANNFAIPFAADWNYFESDNKTNTIPTTNGGRYYIYTGYEISGPIMTFFDSKDGLSKVGYPTGPQIVSGTTKISQQFQHDTITCTLQARQCQFS